VPPASRDAQDVVVLMLPPSAGSVRRAGMVLERLFRVTLTDEEWRCLAKIMQRAWIAQSRVLLDIHHRLDQFWSSTGEISRDERRDLIAALAGLQRIGEAREYASWLHALLMRRQE
jgi:hypothetical protein